MRASPLVVVLLPLALISAGVAHTDTAEAILSRAGNGLVVIEAKVGGKTAASLGLGVVIAKHQIATDCTLINKSLHITALPVSGTTVGSVPIRVTPSRFDAKRNICLLRAYLPHVEPLKMRPSADLQANEAILALSVPPRQPDAPLVLEPGLGAIVNLAGRKNVGESLIKTDIRNQNNRANKVVLDIQGRLVGIQIFGRNAEISYAMSTEWIQQAAREGLESKRVTHSVEVHNNWLLSAVLLHNASPDNMQKLLKNSRQWQQQNPGAKDAQYYLGIAYARLDKPRQALAAFRSALQLSRKDAYIWYQLGNQYRALGQSTDAMRSYAKALEIRPQLAPAMVASAQLHHQHGDAQRAFELYHQVIQYRPERADAWHGIGRALRDASRPQEALNAYRTATRHDPDNSIYHRDLAAQFIAEGQYSEALDSLRTSLSMNANDADTLTLAGTAHRLSNRLDRAIEHYQRALRLNSKVDRAWYGLGLAYAAANDRQRAMGIYEKLQTLDSPLAGQLYQKAIRQK